MFLAAAGAPIPYEDPWHLEFEERLSALRLSNRRIAYFCEAPNAHTFRYRVFNMVEALNARDDLDISAAWFTEDDLARGHGFVDRADVLVISRVRYSASVGGLIARARARNIPVFYDIDDLIFDVRYAHTIGRSINRSLNKSEEWDWWFGYISRLGCTLQMCDAVITTNEFLGERVREFHPPVQTKIIPNFYNRWQAVVSNEIFQRKIQSKFRRDGRIHVGYFSGTNTHDNDFKIVSEPLQRLLAKNSHLVLRMVGDVNLTESLRGFSSQIETVPIQDFLNLQRVQGETEICVAPLQNTVFANCKSDLKYFESTLAGSVTIASHTFAFKHAIEDGINGFLAHTHEWEDKINAAIDRVETDLVSYQSYVEKARDVVEARYSWSRQADLIVSEIFKAF